jgi:light-regulated signal transduction histidine kinase (bacteriophytochrome)/CheY-like chemotaxis protein
VIADAHDEGVPVFTGSGAPLDLSLASLRSVSPVHLEYLRNMGTAASMSISLIVDGSLWGLIACHHRRPLRPTLACRAMAELLGHLYSLALSRADRQPLEHDIRGALGSAQGVDPLVDAQHDPAGHDAACEAIGRTMALTGVVTQVEGQVRRWGLAPTEAQTGQILQALAGMSTRPVTAVESLGGLQADLGQLSPGVAGLLALPLGAKGRDWVLLLRDEVERHVHWAGEPGQAPGRRPDGRLSPRSSFASWLASVKGHCEPWTVAEQELAQVVRGRLLEVLAGRHEQRVIESTRQAARQQALLVRELNHRVRNMLGLIKGLVQQTARNASSVEDLTARLHDRVHALARAYTQIEQAHWQPASLSALLLEETGAFGEPGQLGVQGRPVLLEPQAYLSFAMVIHELATNARKYGALSVPQGRVSVSWRFSADEGLELDWRETGGPPVTAPKRKGFGTRVIRQGLEHQLHGHATVDFEPAGLHVRLWTPRGFVPQPASAAPPGTGEPDAVRVPPPAADQPAPAMPGAVLVLEDDLVIALLAESMLQQLGCSTVITAGTADDALRLLRTQTVGLALLDVNLGDHSSEPVARRLAELGVPMLVTTGYSDTDSVPEPLRRVRRLSKPYTKTELTQAITRVLAG